MSQGWLVFIIIFAVVAVVLLVLYFLGKRMQKKQEAQKQQMEEVAQTVSLLVIDKKKMRLKDAGLPQAVMDAAPKLARRAKVPVVKAKIGPKVTSLLCEDGVFKVIPVKKECKVVVSGLYITDIKSARGGIEQPVKKKGLLGRFSK